MSANIHPNQLLTVDLTAQQKFTTRVLAVLFEGTSAYAGAPGKTWRELLIVDTPTGVVLRDRVRENRNGHDRTISCDWQMFPNVNVCSTWLEPNNKLESRARVALARRAA